MWTDADVATPATDQMWTDADVVDDGVKLKLAKAKADLAKFNAPKERSGWEKLAEGGAASATRTVAGLQDMLGFKPIATKQELADLDALKDSSWQGKVGDFGMSVAPMLIPGTAGLKASTALSGTMGAAQANEGNRVRGAVEGAIGNIIGQKAVTGLVHLLRKAVPATADATKLMAQDVVPTLGAGAATNTVRGKIANTLENWGRNSRFLRSSVKAQVGQGEEALRTQALKRSEMPNFNAVDKTLPFEEQVAQRAGDFKKAYADMMRDAYHATSPELSQTMATIAKRHDLSPAQTRKLNTFLQNEYAGRFNPGIADHRIPVSTLQDVRDALNKGNLDLPEGVVNDLQQAFRGEIDNALTAGGKDVKALNKARSEFYPVEAASKANVVDGFTATQYNRAVRNNAANAGQIAGSKTAPGAELSAAAARTLRGMGKDETSAIADLALNSVTGGIPYMLLRSGAWATHNPATRKLLMNDPAQVAKALRAAGKVGRVAGPVVAASQFNKEQDDAKK